MVRIKRGKAKGLYGTIKDVSYIGEGRKQVSILLKVQMSNRKYAELLYEFDDDEIKDIPKYFSFL